MSELYRRTNRLLALLSDDDYERLRPHLAHVALEQRKSLYEASIGSEGVVGSPVCLGERVAPRDHFDRLLPHLSRAECFQIAL